MSEKLYIVEATVKVVRTMRVLAPNEHEAVALARMRLPAEFAAGEMGVREDRTYEGRAF